MATASLHIRLNYNQVLNLARQLSDEDKLMLNRELAAETRTIKLKQLQDAFKDDTISLKEIDEEVESVRQELHERKLRD